MQQVKRQKTHHYKFIHHTFVRNDGKTVDKLYPFDANNVTIGKPHKKNFGKYTLERKYHLVDPEENIDADIPIRFQTPPMYAPFGKKDWLFEKKSGGDYSANINPDAPQAMKTDANGNDGKDKDKDKAKSSMALSFWNAEKDPAVRAFMEDLADLDDVTVSLAVKNKDEWWECGPDLVPEVIKAFYIPLSKSKKRDSNGNLYPPLLGCKLPKRMGKILTKFYDNSKPPAPVTVNEVKKGCKCVCLIKDTGLWMEPTKFKSGFDTIQCQIVDYTDAEMEDEVPCTIVGDDGEHERSDVGAEYNA